MIGRPRHTRFYTGDLLPHAAASTVGSERIERLLLQLGLARLWRAAKLSSVLSCAASGAPWSDAISFIAAYEFEDRLARAAAQLAPEVGDLGGGRGVAQRVRARDDVVERLAVEGDEGRVRLGTEARDPVVRPLPVRRVLVGVPQLAEPAILAGRQHVGDARALVEEHLDLAVDDVVEQRHRVALLEDDLVRLKLAPLRARLAQQRREVAQRHAVRRERGSYSFCSSASSVMQVCWRRTSCVSRRRLTR